MGMFIRVSLNLANKMELANLFGSKDQNISEIINKV